jgi:hypothetical protein
MKANEKDSPWFMSEDGIRAHYAEQREAEDAAHRDRVKRINDDELACLEAFKNRLG